MTSQVRLFLACVGLGALLVGFIYFDIPVLYLMPKKNQSSGNQAEPPPYGNTVRQLTVTTVIPTRHNESPVGTQTQTTPPAGHASPRPWNYAPPSAAIVVQPAQRNRSGSWGKRLCLFLHMIQSVERRFNEALNTSYPIFVLVSSDPADDPGGADAVYSQDDRALIRSWAPHSNITFVEIPMYTGAALPADTTVGQINRWAVGLDGGVGGRPLGYRSMCRLWSGRLQHMAFLDRFEFYMRLDDDSFFVKDLTFDPFEKARDEDLDYIYRRHANDPWGIDKLTEVAARHGRFSNKTQVPYTNFHLARVSLFRTPEYKKFWADCEETKLFMKHRVGDALLHAAILELFTTPKRVRVIPQIPHAHNVNDFKGFPPKHWIPECPPFIRGHVRPAVVARPLTAAIVVHAPPRNKGFEGHTLGKWGRRLCLFLHMIRSVDTHLNKALNKTYPIFVLVSTDPEGDSLGDDAIYSSEDRALIRSWAPNSQVSFVDIPMYTGTALPPDTTVDQVKRWSEGLDGGVAGRALGYRAMCRLWSGRLQNMKFLDDFELYMRLDDDSFFTKDLENDPFQLAHDEELDYLYVKRNPDPWGKAQLKELTNRHGVFNENQSSPYTNFHIARVAVFRSDRFKQFWSDLDSTKLFMKYRVGDALLHSAILDLFVPKPRQRTLPALPYAHNENDFPGYPPQAWHKECPALAVGNVRTSP